jgi:hypothetical protein
MPSRRSIVAVLMVVMVSPLWGIGEPLGAITASSDAEVRGTKLTPGSTVFIGDLVSVAAHGGARIALTGGPQAEILGDSSVQLTVADKQVQLVVDRGQASFHTSSGTGISAQVADATVRPANKVETSAVIQSLSGTHAIVAAEKGALLVTTAYDGKVYTVPEGEAADLTAVPDPPQSGPPRPGGRTISSRKKAVIWVVAVGGGGVALASYLLLRKETKLPLTTLENEISPAKLN